MSHELPGVIMKYLILLLLIVPSIFALSPYEAAEHGENFIKENAMVGHFGKPAEYSVRLTAVYQNERDYRVYYELKGIVNGIERKRGLMLEMSKQGKIKKVYISRKQEMWL